MKTIKLFTLLSALMVSTWAMAATLTISGTVLDNGTAKSGVTVTWLDSASSTTATAVTNSSGQYTLSVNTGTSTQGMMLGEITGCNGQKFYKYFFYSPRTSNYPNNNFTYCNGPFTMNISGTVTNLGAGTYKVYADSLGMVFPNWTKTVTSSNNTFNFTYSVRSNPQDVWVYMVDCKGDTLWKKVVVTSSNPNATVNFNYCKQSSASQKISGIVYTGNTTATAGVALLFEKSAGTVIPVDSSLIQRGNYSFSSVDSTKTYVVLAILGSTDPNYGKYLPTYADSAAAWGSAASLANATGANISRNVYMIKAKPGTGNGRIGGKVVKGKSRADRPMPGLQINLMQNGKAIAYTVSDANGEFAFENLDMGTYTVYPEEFGSSTTSKDITLANGATAENGIRITAEKNALKVEVVITGLRSFDSNLGTSVYPNPAQENLTVNFGQVVEAAVITVSDLNGREMIKQVVSNTSNEVVSVAALNAGIYLVSIASENGTELIKIVKH